MDNKKMKNMLVLRNLPSNIIEEVFVVIKDNQKLKKYEYIDGQNQNFNRDKEENDIVIREAENIILDYINKIENQDICGNKYNFELKKKYKKMKKFVIFSYVIIIGLIFFIY